MTGAPRGRGTARRVGKAIHAVSELLSWCLGGISRYVCTKNGVDVSRTSHWHWTWVGPLTARGCFCRDVGDESLPPGPQGLSARACVAILCLPPGKFCCLDILGSCLG